MDKPLTLRGARVLLERLEAVRDAAKTVKDPTADSHMNNFMAIIGELVTVVQSHQEIAVRGLPNSSLHKRCQRGDELLQSVFRRTSAVLEECGGSMQPLPSAIKSQQRAWHAFASLIADLYNHVLAALLGSIHLLHGEPNTHNDTLSRTIRGHVDCAKSILAGERLGTQDVVKALEEAEDVAKNPAFVKNEYFSTMRMVRACFSGREKQLGILKTAFQDPWKPCQQRFIIYGLSGCGKTELASRFASDVQHHFFGVFVVDGSSQKTVSSSYAEIAAEVGKHPNESAAKKWLGNCTLPWLLIVDNLDTDRIDKVLPATTNGCVLITTRNPSLGVHGNTGQKYMRLEALELEEAETCLINAAGQSHVAPSDRQHVREICHALGCLPLALVHAGTSVSAGMQWSQYLSIYNARFKAIKANDSRKRVENSGQNSPAGDDDEDTDFSIFSSYELLYELLENSCQRRFQDAKELLHVFSFYHFQNICPEVLVKAATNPLKEDPAQIAISASQIWSDPFGMLRAMAIMKLATGPLPLPAALRNPNGLCAGALERNVRVRLSDALEVLVERSLISVQNRADDLYSMHSLVHEWVRRRPKMRTTHQALWCQVSMTTLALSILRPDPRATEEELQNDENRRRTRELLPHILHALNCKQDLDKEIMEDAERAPFRWLLPNRARSTYRYMQGQQDVRFSIVYFETGRYEKARELQERAYTYARDQLGRGHRITISLSLLWCRTLSATSEIAKASHLLRGAYELCKQQFGENDALTLDVADSFASCLRTKGRWAEARRLHTDTLAKMQQVYGSDHVKTLKATVHLGQVLYWLMEHAEATTHFQAAWDGLHQTIGEDNLETLTALQELALSRLRLDKLALSAADKQALEDSLKKMSFVYERRKKKLGSEHPLTLLAMLHLARIKSEVGDHATAEGMIRNVLDMATGSVVPDHIAIVMARTIHAQVLTRLQRYGEAEELFKDLIKKAHYRKFVDDDGDHTDRLCNIWLLAKCFRLQDKKEEELGMCREFLAGAEKLGGHGLGMQHPMIPTIRGRISELEQEEMGQTPV